VPNVVGQDTILDGDLPDRSANYSSLAAFAAKTQEDWDAELRGAEEERWGERVLGGLFEGLEQGKPFVLALLQAMIQAIFDDPITNYPDPDSALVGIASAFNGKWRELLTLKDASLYTSAQAAAAGRPIYDLFDGSSGAISSSKWDVSYVQPLAGGRVRQDGNGNCWWSGFGFAPRTARARYTAATTDTDVQIVKVVMPTTVQDPSLLGQPSHLRLLGRCDSTLDNYVYAEISDDGVELGCVVDGDETVWATTTATPADSDAWDFHVGTSGNNYYMKLNRNGVLAIDYDDVANDSVKGAAFRSVGFEMHAASRGLYGQTSPGTMAVFSADDN
jgi:hypothetical protein